MLPLHQLKTALDQDEPQLEQPSLQQRMQYLQPAVCHKQMKAQQLPTQALPKNCSCCGRTTFLGTMSRLSLLNPLHKRRRTHGLLLPPPPSQVVSAAVQANSAVSPLHPCCTQCPLLTLYAKNQTMMLQLISKKRSRERPLLTKCTIIPAV